MTSPNEPPRYGRTLYDLIAEVLNRPRLLLLIASLTVVLAILLLILATKGYVTIPWLGHPTSASSVPSNAPNVSSEETDATYSGKSSTLASAPGTSSTTNSSSELPPTTATENDSSQGEPPERKLEVVAHAPPFGERVQKNTHAIAKKLDDTTSGPAQQTKKAVVSPTKNVDGTIWQLPVAGQILTQFDPKSAIPGIDFQGQSGEIINAATDGTVVYSGHGLNGYGEVTIVKLNNDVLVSYGLTGTRLTSEGQKIFRGEPIAKFHNKPARLSSFLFQVRFDGNPVDPLKYLP